MIWAVLQYTRFNYEMHVHNLLIFLFLSNDCGVSFEVSPHCDELIFAIWIERLSWLILRVVWMFNVVWFVFFLSQIKLPLISEAYFNYRTCLIQQLIERENVMINEKKNVLNTNKEKTEWGEFSFSQRKTILKWLVLRFDAVWTESKCKYSVWWTINLCFVIKFVRSMLMLRACLSFVNLFHRNAKMKRRRTKKNER